MASKKEQLTTELTADDRKLNRQLKESESKWKKYGKRIAAVAAVASAAFVAAGKKAADYGSSIAKQARALNLTVKAMQQIKSLSDSTGVNVSSLAGAVGTFEQRNRMGKGQFGGNLEAMGFTTLQRQMIRDPKSDMSEVQKLTLLAKGLKTFQNPEEKERAAMHMFGKNSDAMLALSRMTSLQLDIVRDQATARTMTASGSSVGEAEAIKNNLKALGQKTNPLEAFGKFVFPTANKGLDKLNEYLGEKGLLERVLNKLDGAF